MEITFDNLGIIENAKIDLKPLTIFIGPNNGGENMDSLYSRRYFWSSGLLGVYERPYAR